MVTFKINNQKIKCPTSWDEITVSQFILLRKAIGLSEVFKALTGSDLDITVEQLEYNVFPYLTFIADKPEFDKLPIPENITWEYKPIKNLGHGTGAQKIAAQKIISNAFKDNPKEVEAISFMIPLLNVYMPGAIIGNLLFVKCYPIFNHYCAEILRLVKRDKEFLSNKPEPEMILAGVDKLDKFGDISLIDQLSGGDMLKYDAILAMEYDVIFKKLWYMKEKELFEKRLRDVYRNKKNNKAA